jgi:hypothetical protein
MSRQINIPLSANEWKCLLDELCIRLGVRLPLKAIDQLEKKQLLDARDFADEVFRAEGLNPRTADKFLWAQVRNTIDAHFSDSRDNTTAG